MKWSKLKKTIESYFADSVKGRVELRSTRYHKSHDQEGRGYITIDKEEVASFCSITAWNSEYKLAEEIREISGATNFRNPSHQKEYYQAYDQAENILHKQGIYSQYEFYDSLKSYLNLPLDEALKSDNLIILSLAILDRRLGKRRITLQKESYSQHAVLKKLFEFRCTVENITC